MKSNYDKIIQPLLTEKTNKQQKKFNEYTVIVHGDSTKTEIKKMVHEIFGVIPLKVRTINFRKKEKRNKFGVTPAASYKKAQLRLPEGSRLELA